MKRVIENFSAIRRVLESNSVVFENKPNAILMKDRFITKVETLSTLEQSLVRPYKSLVAQRVGLRTQLQAQLIALVDFGIMLAKTVDDSSLLVTFTHYRRQVHSCASAKKLQMAADALALIAGHEEEAQKLGFDATAVAALQKLMSDFRLTASDTGNRLDERRNERQQKTTLVRECYRILQLELDRFVRFNAATWPAFADNYFRLRRKKGSSKNGTDVSSEIFGKVTDSLTGNPLAGALLHIAEENEDMTTGSDGKFNFDALPPGTFYLSCVCSGYITPETAVIRLAKDDVVEWNFQLVKLTS